MKVKHNTKTAHYCNEQLSPTKDFGVAHKVALWPLNLGPLAVVCGSCADRWWCSGHQSCTHRHTRLSQHLSTRQHRLGTETFPEKPAVKRSEAFILITQSPFPLTMCEFGFRAPSSGLSGRWGAVWTGPQALPVSQLVSH